MRKIITLMAVMLTMAVTAKAQTWVVYDDVDSQFYSEDNDLLLTIYGGGMYFLFDIVCVPGATDIVDGQTYTLSDMLSDFSGVSLDGYYFTSHYQSASLVRNSDGTYVADVTLTNGQQYHITKQLPPAIAEYKDTIDVLMDNARINRLDDQTTAFGAFQLIGADAANQYEMYLAVYSDQIAGNYTNEDVYFSASGIYDGSEAKTINSVNDFTVTGDATACSTYVEIITADSILYRINYSYPGVTPAPSDTISITMNSASNSVLDYTSYGFFELDGYDQTMEYELYLSVNSYQIAGSYTQDDVDEAYTYLRHNDEYFAILEISDFTVTGNSKNCSTYVELVGENNILYRINFSYTKPAIVPTDTVVITMTDSEVNTVTDYTKSLGYFIFTGEDQNNYQLGLMVFSDQMAGTYTQDDVYDYYLYYGSSIDIDEIRDFTVAGNAKSCSTYVEIVSKDSVLYKITYSYTYTPLDTKDTIDITMDNATMNIIYDQIVTSGFYQMIGADSNDEYRMRLIIYSDKIAGTYTQSAVDMYYTYLAHCLPGDTTSIAIEEIRDFTVTGDEYACNAYIEIISTDSVLYRITYSYSYGIKDTVDIVMDNENNRVYDVTATDGYFMLVGADQAGEYAMALMVVSDQMAGTYGAADIYGVELASISGTDTTYITLQRASAFTVEGDSTWCTTNLVFISEDSVMYRITFEYGEEPSAVENTVEEPEFVVVSENNTIVVYGVEDQMMAVYDMAGRTIMNSKSTSDIERIDVAVPGIYVVRVAGKAAKVLVK